MLGERNPGWRLFVAAPLPGSVSQGLKLFQDEIKREWAGTPESFRWAHVEDLHLTLFFIGNVEPDKISSLSAAIHEITETHGSLTASLIGLGAFPGPQQPKVLWAGLKENPKLRALQSKVAEKIVSLGFKKDREKFTPHVTLARVKGEQAMEGLFERHEIHPLGEFEISDLVLYRSRPNPSGPKYQALERFSLRK